MRISDWSSDVCSSDLITSGFACCTQCGIQVARVRCDEVGIHHAMRRKPGQQTVEQGHIAAGIERQMQIGDIASRRAAWVDHDHLQRRRSEEHTSELQSLMRISYDVFCLKKKTTKTQTRIINKIIQN